MKKPLCLMVATALMMASGLCGGMPKAAVETKNLLVNGDFSDDLTGWSARDADTMNMEVNEDFQAVLSDDTAGGELQQYVEIDPEAVYKLSFRMKNSVAGALEISKSLYYVKNEQGKYVAPDAENDRSLSITAAESAKFPCTFGRETENPGWKTYETTINVPSKDINALRILMTFKADEAFAIDDISLEKVSDTYGTIVNGSFEADDKEGGAAAWTLFQFEAETDETGNRYAKISDTTNAGSNTVNSRPRVSQDVYAKPGTTLRFSFKMKNSIAKVMVFSYQVFDSTLNVAKDGIKGILKDYPMLFGEAREGEAQNEWRSYSIDIPVPVYGDTVVPALVRFRLEAMEKDEKLAIDDVSVSCCKDYVEYIMNGDFEMSIPEKVNDWMNGWRSFATADATREADANGNHFVKIVSTEAANQCIRTQVSLMPGRYKLSFRIKKSQSTTRPFEIALTHTALALGDNDGYLNGILDKTTMAEVPIYTADTWEKKTIYFTVAADVASTHILLPPNRAWAGTFYLDDFSITEDKDAFGFTETVSCGQYKTGYLFQLESGYEGEVASISAAKTAGRTTIPVTWHYIPQKDGVSDDLTLVAAVYEKDANNRKRLVSVSVVNEKTDISEAAKGGKNGLGVSTLYTTVPIPEDASEAHTVEVMRWKGADSFSMSPYAGKTVLHYN